MSGPWFGCIADDYTGATDLSSMLVRCGLRVVQWFGLPGQDVRSSNGDLLILTDVDAVVIALKSRSIAAPEAIEASLQSLNALQKLGIEHFYFKYCSTFDSTDQGNIGPVAEAIANELGVTDIYYCPAFPENGRTIYSGHLFVNGRLLHESGMENHPLNPMTDSDLVRVLSKQCQGPVGLVSRHQRENRIDEKDPARRAESLRMMAGAKQEPSQGDGQSASSAIRNWIVDAIDNEDLQRMGTMSRDNRLMTGGSALAAFWASAIKEHRRDNSSSAPHSRTLSPEGMGEANRIGRSVEDRGEDDKKVAGTRRESRTRNSSYPVVVLAGSCSLATRKQLVVASEYFPILDTEFASVDVALRNFASLSHSIRGEVESASRWIEFHREGPAVVVATSRTREIVEATKIRFGELLASEMAETFFACLASHLGSIGYHKFVVAGGETSGAVVNALRIQSVSIGAEVAPGVPTVQTLGTPRISLVLKSGNFGGNDFVLRAVEALQNDVPEGMEIG